MIVDCAVYEAGARVAGGLSVDDAARRRDGPGRFVWIGLHEPSAEEFDSVQEEFGLHELAVEDAIKAHQRPKLERYGETHFLVLKTARYDDDREEVDFGEILLFSGADFVITVRHGEASGLSEVRSRLEARPDLLASGPSAVVHGILDRVVDDYLPVVVGLEGDVEEVEAQVFSAGGPSPVERIYFLKREVLEFHRATTPLVAPLEQIVERADLVDPAVHEYFRDVLDHLIRVRERVDSLSDLLTSVLQAGLTQISIRQNEDMRKISAWVAIGVVPTVLAGVYGMNYEHIPASGLRYGFVGAVGVMATISVSLFFFFRRRGWL